MNTIPSFPASFNALTGYRPLRWQTRLFKRLRNGAIPRVCDLPTGLGKTSVIPIWLIALADQGRASVVPRRLVYIVDRRTVVDQATQIVERMRERLRNPGDPRWAARKETLRALGRSLRALSATGKADDPFAVSTLRGELADNQEWKADPTRPAIVVGTIDMIGSKLLFSGYGDGSYHRAHHAGLIGQDALIVHDEAHLTPALSDLLKGVADTQQHTGTLQPVHVMELSATQRESHDDRDVLRLQAEDNNDAIVRDRLHATKHLRLHEVNEDDVIPKLVELARQHDTPPSKVLIYVQSPEQAQKVAQGLKNELGSAADGRVAVLTGTIRGNERDQLVDGNTVYRALLDRETRVEQTVYLVSTSAGEVGIDLDADHIVCDVTTLDAMIQRFGRVNRRGGKGRTASVSVVARHGDPEGKRAADEFGRPIQETKAILERWTAESDGMVNVSPRNLRRLLAKLSVDERLGAFSPKPDVPPLTDILLDAWSLTSIDEMPGRPEVAAYLHGLTHDPPETYVVWRKEVARLNEAQVDRVALRDWFRACRVQPRERLRDRTERIRKQLTTLLSARQGEARGRDFAVVVLDERGEAEWSQLSRIIEKEFNLAYRTVVLPVEAGGIDQGGMLDASATASQTEIDVAEDGTGDDRRERWLDIRTAQAEHYYERLLTGERADILPSALREQERIVLKEQPEVVEGEGEALDLILMVSPRTSALQDPEAARVRQTLREHTNLIVEHMRRIARGLGLEKPIQDALVTAARWHDRGKDREVWQRYARNQDGAEPLAKSMKHLHPRALGYYRHEFGSLLEAEASAELRNHAERDLILHLIAAHHGWTRPHFEPRAFDKSRTTADNTEASLEAMRRFGRLQQRFGHWGLAWLESLVRCADIIASKEAAGKVVYSSKKRESRHEDA